jgi:hypothetical protein
MVNQPHALAGTALVNRLLEGIEDEAGVRRSADAPADDASGILKAKAKRVFEKTLKQLSDTERAQLQLTAVPPNVVVFTLMQQRSASPGLFIPNGWSSSSIESAP